MTLMCPYCNSPAVLQPAEVVYRGTGSTYGKLWVCSNYPRCNAYVGVHKGTDAPLGSLGNPMTRQHRITAHDVFDQLWCGAGARMRRSEAYNMVAQALGVESVHIGGADIATCERIIRVVQDYNKKRARKKR